MRSAGASTVIRTPPKFSAGASADRTPKWGVRLIATTNQYWWYDPAMNNTLKDTYYYSYSLKCSNMSESISEHGKYDSHETLIKVFLKFDTHS